MNLKTTLALVVLAVCAAGLVYTKGQLPTNYDPWRQEVSTSDGAKSREVLDKITPDSLARIEIRRGKETTALERAADGSWVMPGNWPTRPAEVAKLVELVTGLRSRFDALPLEKEGDSKRYGVDSPALSVVVTTKDDSKHTLGFSNTDPDDTNRFDRPTFLRVDELNEVLRLGPGLVAVLDRPSDYYLQRRLFPSARVPRDEGSSAKVERLAARRLVVEEVGKRRFALEGKPAPEKMPGDVAHPTPVDRWELAEPYRDALDPGSRDRLLEAAADLWAEKFLTGEDARDEKTGLKTPERTLTVTREDGRQVTLHIGKPIGALPPLPLPNQKIRYHAKLAGFDRVFEINGDRLKDIFADLGALRDSQLARFSPTDAREITFTTSKGTVVLKNEAKPKPPGADEMTPPPPPDWRIVQPIQVKADNAVVDRLLSALSGASASDKDAGEKSQYAGIAAIGDGTAGPLAALASAFLSDPVRRTGLDPSARKQAASVLVTTEEGKREGQPKTKKTYLVSLGKHDKTAKKLYAASQDWPRINEIGDELAELVLDKSALEYRGKRLLDFPASDVKSLKIERKPGKDEKPQPIALERTPSGWALTEPVKTEADTANVRDLADRLGKLEVLAWVASEVKPEDAEARFGLGTPALTATIAFEDKKPARTLQIGKPRDGQPGSFAKLSDAPEVFVVAEDVVALLKRDSLEYRPSQLWLIEAGDEVVSLKITRTGQDEYTLQRKGADWEVSGPFSVKAPRGVIDKLVSALASPSAMSYLEHAAKDYGKFGLTTPAVKMTLTTKKGKEHVLWLGSEREKATGRHARLGDKGEAVFVVSPALARAADQSALDFLDRDLFKFEPEAVTSFVQTKGKDVMELAKKDDVWRLVKPSEVAADDVKTPALFKALSALKAERIAAYKPKDLKAFGLDQPEATIKLELSGEAKPSEYVLELGAEIKDKPGSRYAALKGGPMVAELSADAVKRLLAGPLTYRDHQVARLPNADTVRLEAGARKATFANPEGTWKLTQPLAGDADHDALTAFLNGLARLRADEFAAQKPTAEQLKTFGLDKPATRWQFLDGEQVKLDLVIGGTEKGGTRRYARLQGGDEVFLLDAKLSEQAVAEYRPRGVFKDNIDPAQIEGVKFGYRKDAFELKKGDKWEVVGKAEARVNTKALTDTLSALRDLKLERYVVDDKAQLKLFGLDPVELTLEVTTPGGKVTLLIGGLEGDTKKRYARSATAGRADVFLLDAATSTKLFRDLGALTEKE